MAILYGTTAEGDSLPVEVNNLGQLVAEGLPGPPGPDGPPGIGELPPDPVEGDTLIWKDGQLVWEPASGGGMQIKQIQRGFIVMLVGQPEVLASISFVDPAKSLLTMLGFTAFQDQQGVAISLDSGSRILAIRTGDAGPTTKVSYELIEYE